MGACTQEDKHLEHSSPDLNISKLSEHCYLHTSYLDTESFGKVPCNGLIVVKNDRAIIYDTPTTDSVSSELIDILSAKGIMIDGVVSTHFHVDCLGGLRAFHEAGIPSYGNIRTIEFAKRDSVIAPINPINDSMRIKMEGLELLVGFYGEGHTKDNMIAYIPEDKVMFGGCLVKSNGAGKGNLADANIEAWPKSIERVRERFPDVDVVVPGHGEPGDIGLLNYTQDLFHEK